MDVMRLDGSGNENQIRCWEYSSRESGCKTNGVCISLVESSHICISLKVSPIS